MRVDPQAQNLLDLVDCFRDGGHAHVVMEVALELLSRKVLQGVAPEPSGGPGCGSSQRVAPGGPPAGPSGNILLRVLAVRHSVDPEVRQALGKIQQQQQPWSSLVPSPAAAHGGSECAGTPPPPLVIDDEDAVAAGIALLAAGQPSDSLPPLMCEVLRCIEVLVRDCSALQR